jgi:hypothetical protein
MSMNFGEKYVCESVKEQEDGEDNNPQKSQNRMKREKE